MKRTPVGTDTNAATEAANRKQGEYYRSLLIEQRDEIDCVIVDYLDTVSGGGMDVETARELRRTVRKAERERQAIDRMIAAIDARFTVMNRPGEPHQQRAADARPLVPMSQRRPNIAVDRLRDKRVG
jgi:hypothetical protein